MPTSNSRWKSWSWVATIAVVALFVLVRLSGIRHVVGTDDEAWLGAGARMVWFLTRGDFGATQIWTHPGLPVVWAGVLSLLSFDPGFGSNVPLDLGSRMDQVLRLHFDRSPMDTMVIARLFKLGFQAILMIVSLKFVRDLFGTRVMIVAGALIALEPFLSGNDTLLVPDGFLGTACFAAVLAGTIALRSDGKAKRWWLLAGALSGIAILTRWNAIVILPAMGACLVLPVLWTRPFSLRTVPGTLRKLGWWLLAASITTYALWPALWTTPVATLRQVYDYAIFSAREGHENAVFYNGNIDPIIHSPFFYFEAIAWRLTPVVLIGLLCFVGVLVWRRRWREDLSLLGPSMLFVVIYFIGMSAGGKKFDRYIIPVFPFFLLFSAWAFDMLLVRLRAPLRGWWMPCATAAMALIVGVQGIAAIQALPYRLDYYNPLMGGAKEAQYSMGMGWGEGAWEVLAWIDQQTPAGEPITVGVQNATAFYYLTPDSITISKETPNRPKAWFENSYYAATIQYWQRWPFTLGHYAPLVHTVQINGVDFWRIYDIRGLAYPARLEMKLGCRVEFASGLVLLDVAEEGDELALYFIDRELTRDQSFTIDAILSVPGSHSRESAHASTTFRVDAAEHIARVGLPVPELPQGSSRIGPIVLDFTVSDTDEKTTLSGYQFLTQTEDSRFTLNGSCSGEKVPPDIRT